MTDRELMQQALEALEDARNGSQRKPSEPVITALRERLAQPEQEQNSTCNKTLRAEGKGYPRTCRKCGKGPCIADRVQPEQTQLDAIPDAFNEWWDADYDDTGNPYRKDSPAYWAWSGWKAASKQQEQEPVAWEDVLGAIARGWTHDDNKHKPMDVQLAVAIAKEIQDMVSAPPQRKPLTEEEIDELSRTMVKGDRSVNWLCRAIERAHGIGEKPDAA